jgi:hypothetical protein
VAQGLGQVGLAHAGGPLDQDVLVALNEASGRSDSTVSCWRPSTCQSRL